MTNKEFVSLSLISVANYLFISPLAGIWLLLFGIVVILHDK
jgi:hypothetical protein